MENCFYDRQISRIYDLKGSERNRFNADAAANPQVRHRCRRLAAVHTSMLCVLLDAASQRAWCLFCRVMIGIPPCLYVSGHSASARWQSSPVRRLRRLAAGWEQPRCRHLLPAVCCPSCTCTPNSWPGRMHGFLSACHMADEADCCAPLMLLLLQPLILHTQCGCESMHSSSCFAHVHCIICSAAQRCSCWMSACTAVVLPDYACRARGSALPQCPSAQSARLGCLLRLRTGTCTTTLSKHVRHVYYMCLAQLPCTVHCSCAAVLYGLPAHVAVLPDDA